MSTKTDATRLAILEAAWKRLMRGDPAHLADIARDADVSRQALYLHFGSRAGLLVELVQHIDRRMGLTQLVKGVNATRDPEDRLIVALRASARYAPKVQVAAMALVRLRENDPDARAALADRMEGRRRGLQAIVRAIARRGKLHPAWTARRAADALLAASSPHMWDLLVTEWGWSPKEFEAWLVHLGESMLKR